MSKQQKCAAKISSPSTSGMQVCGLPCVYLTAEQAQETGRLYSGWHHVDSAAVDHHAVPASLVS